MLKWIKSVLGYSRYQTRKEFEEKERALFARIEELNAELEEIQKAKIKVIYQPKVQPVIVLKNNASTELLKISKRRLSKRNITPSDLGVGITTALAAAMLVEGYGARVVTSRINVPFVAGTIPPE